MTPGIFKLLAVVAFPGAFLIAFLVEKVSCFAAAELTTGPSILPNHGHESAKTSTRLKTNELSVC